MKALMFLLLASPAFGQVQVTDAAGRVVEVPENPARVFAAGPPAAVLLYALKPEAMVGWVRAPGAQDLPYLLPATHDLPELGRLTGRGDTLNLEVLLTTKPDLIVDFGTVNATYRDLADRVQEQAGVPYVLIDGSFADTPASITQLADILGVEARGAELAAYAEETFAKVDAQLAQITERPSVYLARGPEGLESPAQGSINAEIIERVGARNVVVAETKGLTTVSPEQVLAWAPEVIVTLAPDFKPAIEWASVPAVAEGRVYVAPSHPFGFIDSPPSVNRLIGMRWLMHTLYPQTGGDIAAEVRHFYRLFWQVELDDAAVARVLAP